MGPSALFSGSRNITRTTPQLQEAEVVGVLGVVGLRCVHVKVGVKMA